MKTRVFALILSLTLLALTACSGSPAEAAPTEAATTQPTTEAATEAASEAPAGEAGSPIRTNEEITAEIEAVAEACSDAIAGFELVTDEYDFEHPSPESEQRFGDIIGALGYPYLGEGPGVIHYEMIQDFCAAEKAGEDAQILIFGLSNTGIYAEIYTSEGGEATYGRADYAFPASLEPGSRLMVEFGSRRAFDFLNLSRWGRLYMSIQDVDGDGSTLRAFRVVPLSDEDIALKEKYLLTGLAVDGGLYSVNWSAEEYGRLSLSRAFSEFYELDYGEEPSRYDVSWPDDETAIQLTPAEVVEAVLTKHLPFTQEQLRGWGAYLQENDVYLFDRELLSVLNMSFVFGEVVGHRENADGSITLTVSESRLGDEDDGITHELTVADNPDGSFRYLSNTILAEE